MDLFTLVARLTLNTKEYDSALKQAESDAKDVHDITASLTLDDEDFQEKIESAQAETVDDQEPTLTLEDEQFQTDIDKDQEEKVDDQEPVLTLDDEQFQTDIAEDQTEKVDDQEPTLTLQDDEYKGALDQAQADTETFSGAVGDIFDGLKGILAAAGITVAISGIVSNLSEAVDLARSIGDNIDKSSRAMSLSTDAYQEWSHVMDINGASVTDLNRGLMNMRKVLGGGEASKEFTEAMDKLGLSTKKTNGELKTSEELLDETLKALADFDTSTSEGLAERDMLAQSLFGRGGTKLNAMFDGTSKDIEDLKQQAHDLGLVMSEESVSNAAAYNDAVTNMNASIESFRVAIVESILPALTDVFNKVAAIVAFFNPRTHENGLAEQLGDINEQLGMDIVDIEATSKAAGTMIDKLFSMGDATKLTAEEQAEWKATAEWLVQNIPSLSEVIDTDTLSISANKDEVIALTKEWKNYAIERAKADALKSMQEALAKKTTQWLEAEAEAVRLEGEAEKARNKVWEIAQRDFGNMPENRQLDLAKRFGYEDVESLLASETGLQGIANLLSSAYSEQGFSGYGSRELDTAIAESETAMDSYAIQLQEAREKADGLKTEVEEGQTQLAEYSATLDEVVGNLTKTGDELGGASKDAKEADESITNLTASVEALNQALEKVQGFSLFGLGKPKSHAIGSAYIPFDNYPAILHRGERVLPAAEARQQGNEYLSGADIGREIREAMERVNVMMSGEKVGNLTTKRVERNIRADNYSKLRAMGG